MLWIVDAVILSRKTCSSFNMTSRNESIRTSYLTFKQKNKMLCNGERCSSWLFQDTIPAFVQKDCGYSRKASVRIDLPYMRFDQARSVVVLSSCAVNLLEICMYFTSVNKIYLLRVVKQFYSYDSILLARAQGMRIFHMWKENYSVGRPFGNSCE